MWELTQQLNDLPPCTVLELVDPVPDKAEIGYRVAHAQLLGLIGGECH